MAGGAAEAPVLVIEVAEAKVGGMSRREEHDWDQEKADNM